MKFLLYADGTYIGWSQFEKGDPPMGVVSGILYPDEAYSAVRSVFLEGKKNPEERTNVFLEVRAEDGFLFHPTGGVYVQDYFDEWQDEDAREVTMLGVPSEEYMRYFAEHWLQYEEHFRRDDQGP